MNIATDHIERDHEAIAECIERFERRSYRSIALELCTMIGRHEAMEAELLLPALREHLPALADEEQRHHDVIAAEAARLQTVSDKSELKDGVLALIDDWRTHAGDEIARVLPAMEDAMGVVAMNRIGIQLLEWQQAEARAERESDDALDELLALSRAELYEKAQAEDITGRSSMNKDELAEALADS